MNNDFEIFKSKAVVTKNQVEYIHRLFKRSNINKSKYSVERYIKKKI